MLAAALEDDDTLYWEEEATKPPSPKCKQPQAEEESLEDSILTVNTDMRTPKLALKHKQATTGKQKNQTHFASNSQTVASQATSISQLMEMVSTVQHENQTIMSRFDQLMEQIAELLSAQNNPTHSSQARGHGSDSGNKPWWRCATKEIRSIQLGKVLIIRNHPQKILSHLWKKGL